MYPQLKITLETLQNFDVIPTHRKAILMRLVAFIQQQTRQQLPVYLQFVCTHNSRRSHLAQVWAQVAAAYYNIPNVFCYSGGTEVTALCATVVEILIHQGFEIIKISDNSNSIYTIKFDENALPIIGFSKQYTHHFNPASAFAAIMTCSQADADCPYIAGASQRIPMTYNDPKIADGTAQQTEVYLQSSTEIATEMLYVFSQITL